MTSGNGNTNSTQHNGESKRAQAIVKSHILTHLIEGFVIQEGAEPFPVSTGPMYVSINANVCLVHEYTAWKWQQKIRFDTSDRI